MHAGIRAYSPAPHHPPFQHLLLAGMASLRLRNVLGLPGIQFKRKSPFSAVLEQISLVNRRSLPHVLEGVRGSNWDVMCSNFTALMTELFLQNMLDPEHLRTEVRTVCSFNAKCFRVTA